MLLSVSDPLFCDIDQMFELQAKVGAMFTIGLAASSTRSKLTPNGAEI